MAVTVAAFNAAFIALANIYTDKFENWKTAKVYSNGVMQVSIFVSVNYKEDATGIEDEIIKYVQKNAVIHSLNSDAPLTWANSTESNGFYHDIDHAGTQRNDTKATSDIRVPLYFTVPAYSEGEHRWIAKLGEEETSQLVTITIKRHVVDESNFEIITEGWYDEADLRILRYKPGIYPDMHRLRKLRKYKGLKFTGTGGNTWISMFKRTNGHKLGAFLEYKSLSVNVGRSDYYYYPDDVSASEYCCYTWHKRKTSGYGWESGQDTPSDRLESAWNDGIVMILIREKTFFLKRAITVQGVDFWISEEFWIHDFEVEDTFGSRVAIFINWDVSGSWWGGWSVTKADLIYP